MYEDANYLKKVREQYENYPYPDRKAEEELERLVATTTDYLPLINHYGFGGKQDFSKDFRFLVAGGGTGDTTIFLAEQLRYKNLDLVYVDISEASMAIAKRRAELRKLNNIRFVHASLLDLPKMDLGQFDYISCSGVLHHLADPDEGLAALKAVLKPNGLIALMLYATYGRTGVYHMQDLMRRINREEPDLQKQVENTKIMLQSLPSSNWFHLSAKRFRDWQTSDVGVYDMFLHSQDRSYTVDEVYDYVERAGLHFGNFVDPQYVWLYHPESLIKDPALAEEVAKRPLRERQAIGELLSGMISKHTFFATAQADVAAKPDDLNLVPFLLGINHLELAASLQTAGDKNVEITLPSQIKMGVQPNPENVALFAYMDGQRSTEEILQAITNDKVFRHLKREDLLAEFHRMFTVLSQAQAMLLRDKSVPAFPTLQQLHKQAFAKE